MKINEFLKAIDKQGDDDCWNYTRVLVDGYGSLYMSKKYSFGGKYWKAHRLSYFLETGDIPIKGMHLAHTCDNRKCCNPNHLFVATPKQNVQDRVKKGRSGGWRDRKLTKEQVQSIAPRMNKGESVRSIARDFGVSHTTLFQILRGETYTID